MNSTCLFLFSWKTEDPRVNTRGSSVCLTSMRNKQVEFNPYIYSLSKLSRFGYEISVFKNTTGQYSEQPPEQPAHTSRMFLHGKMDVNFFSYVHRSRKHWECKYYKMKNFLEHRQIVLTLIWFSSSN